MITEPCTYTRCPNHGLNSVPAGDSGRCSKPKCVVEADLREGYAAIEIVTTLRKEIQNLRSLLDNADREINTVTGVARDIDSWARKGLILMEGKNSSTFRIGFHFGKAYAMFLRIRALLSKY